MFNWTRVECADDPYFFGTHLFIYFILSLSVSLSVSLSLSLSLSLSVSLSSLFFLFGHQFE